MLSMRIWDLTCDYMNFIRTNGLLQEHYVINMWTSFDLFLKSNMLQS